MIRKALAAGALGAAAALLVPAAAAAATPSDVEGLWASVDVDGSHQAMVVVPLGAGFEVVLVDDYASTCGGGPAVAYGAATLAGDTLAAHLKVVCADHHPTFTVVDDFTFDAATTTLTDSGAAVWSRP